MSDIQNIKQLLTIPQNVVIVSHRNPDGDALGSSLALRLFLEKDGHLVNVILPSEFPSIYGFLAKADKTLIYDIKQDESDALIDRATVIFFLDFNGYDRIDKLGDKISGTSATKIMIDHHLDPDQIADYTFSNPASSSTCEMVFDFIEDLEQTSKIDVYIGESLFTGMITDTGSFKYATNSNTYRVASFLKQVGVDDYTLNDKIYNRLTITVTRSCFSKQNGDPA